MNDNIKHFYWENIAINTYVAKVPSGWLIKSVDTKNDMAAPDDETEVTEENEKRVPIAMSSSMICIEDSTHGWNFDKFRWVNIGRDTWRAMIAGGWIVKCVDVKNLTYFNNITLDQIKISSSMVFVSDVTHSWKLEKPEFED